MELLTAAVMCLAMNVYHEAKNQDIRGQIAVAQVVMNRVEDHRYPNDVCEVVTQGPTRPSWKDKSVYYPVKNRCQFSWYCDGKSDEVPEYDQVAWQYAFMVASGVYYGQVWDLVDGATHYHATYVRPEWASTKTKTIQIGDHIFYRWEK